MTNPYHQEKSEALDYQEWADRRKSGLIHPSDRNSSISSSSSGLIPLDLVIKAPNDASGMDAELIKAPNDASGTDAELIKAPNDGQSITNAGASANYDDSESCETPKKAMIHSKELLICPPAPRKKAGKKRISANHPLEREISANNSNNKRRMIHFLTDPPDLDSFPDCIKALFKP